MNNKQRIEQAKIGKTIKTKATDDARRHNREIIRKTLLASKSIDYTQARQIEDHDNITERIEECYNELYDSEQSTIIHTDSKEIPELTPWEVEAARIDTNNGTGSGNDS